MNNVDCYDSSTSLLQCAYIFNTNECRHSQDVSIRCGRHLSKSHTKISTDTEYILLNDTILSVAFIFIYEFFKNCFHLQFNFYHLFLNF